MSNPRHVSTMTVALCRALALTFALIGANAAAGEASMPWRTLLEGIGPPDVAAHVAQAAPVSEPRDLELVGQIGGGSLAVAVEGDYAYFGMGPSFAIADIRNPVHPMLVGQLPLRWDTVSPGSQMVWNATGIDIVGTTAYVAAWADGLQVIDVSNVRAPRILATVEVADHAHAVHAIGTTAYVAAGAGGLQIIDASDATAPRVVGTVLTPFTANDVYVVGRTAYVASMEGGLQVIDVSDSAAPRIVGALETLYLANSVHGGGAGGVFLGGVMAPAEWLSSALPSGSRLHVAPVYSILGSDAHQAAIVPMAFPGDPDGNARRPRPHP